MKFRLGAGSRAVAARKAVLGQTLSQGRDLRLSVLVSRDPQPFPEITDQAGQIQKSLTTFKLTQRAQSKVLPQTISIYTQEILAQRP